jgi:hypothetical protein
MGCWRVAWGCDSVSLCCLVEGRGVSLDRRGGRRAVAVQLSLLLVAGLGGKEVLMEGLKVDVSAIGKKS